MPARSGGAGNQQPPRTLAFRDGKLTITEGKQSDTYEIREILCNIGGRAFRVVKQDGTGHDVQINGNAGTCDCLGMLRWGHRHPCRHIAALTKLIAEGKLPATSSEGPSGNGPTEGAELPTSPNGERHPRPCPTCRGLATVWAGSPWVDLDRCPTCKGEDTLE